MLFLTNNSTFIHYSLETTILSLLFLARIGYLPLPGFPESGRGEYKISAYRVVGHLYRDILRRLGSSSMDRDGRDVRIEREIKGFRDHGVYMLVGLLLYHQIRQRLARKVWQLHAFLVVRRVLRG